MSRPWRAGQATQLTNISGTSISEIVIAVNHEIYAPMYLLRLRLWRIAMRLSSMKRRKKVRTTRKTLTSLGYYAGMEFGVTP